MHVQDVVDMLGKSCRSTWLKVTTSCKRYKISNETFGKGMPLAL